MASNLTPVSIAAPGFFGLNTQDSPIGLPPEYALEAKNCIIDKLGRVGARKGWQKISDADESIGSSPITLIHEHYEADSDKIVLFIAAGEVWELNMSTGAVTSVYTGAWTGAGTLAGDQNWKAVSFNGYVYFFKRGQNPFYYDSAGSPKVQLVSAAGGYAGTVPLGNEVLSAFGRLWVADTSTDKRTVTFSDSLAGFTWTGGSSGSLNIDSILAGGTRPITALASFNGQLIIFCDTCIIIMEGAAITPASNISLIEVIDGVGCISRDSVIDVGSDIFFLSHTGVRSLGRIISEKSNPLFDISRNVRDDLISEVVRNADNEDIKACYNDLEGFYVLTLLNAGVSYCFDMKNRLENNVCRVTTWTLAPYCWAMTTDKEMLLGQAGYVGEYTGYYDDTASYRFSYKTSHLSTEEANAYKILKNFRIVTVDGAGYTLNLSWGFDYQGLPRSLVRNIGDIGTVSEWGVAEWGTAQWGSLSTINIVTGPLSGYGQVFQFNIDTVIAGAALSIQQIDIHTKLGRLA